MTLFKTINGYTKDYVPIDYKFGIEDNTELKDKNIISVNDKALIIYKYYLNKNILKPGQLIEGNCICLLTDPIFRTPQANDSGKWLVPRNSQYIKYYNGDRRFEFFLKKKTSTGKEFIMKKIITDLFQVYIYTQMYFKEYEKEIKDFLKVCNENSDFYDKKTNKFGFTINKL